MKRPPLPALLVVLALAVYANAFAAGFTLDSKPLILDDPRVHALTRANVDAIVDHPLSSILVGCLLTYDPALKNAAVAAYADAAGEQRAPSRRHPADRRDLNCPAVRRDVCAAGAAAMELQRRVGDEQSAGQLQSAVRPMRCGGV